MPANDVESRLLDVLVRRSYLYRPEKPFVLASGQTSPVYFDCRLTTTFAPALPLVGEALLSRLSALAGGESIVAVGGLTLGADPIAAAVSYYSNATAAPVSWFSVRKEAKGHGTTKWVEGSVEPGDAVAVVDDVVTTGASTVTAIERCRAHGLRVVAAAVLVDRSAGDGRARIEAALERPGRFAALFTRVDLETAWKTMRRTTVAGIVAIVLAVGYAATAHALGDVAVKVTDDGKLKVTGDSNGNTVDIVAGVADGDVVVTGLDGTTINGSALPLGLGGVVRLSADLAKGDDTLQVSGIVFDDRFAAKLGSGTNSLVVDGVTVKKKAKVEGGADADEVTVRGVSSFNAKLEITTGGGPDDVRVSGATMRNDLVIRTAGGHDTVEILTTCFHSDAALCLEMKGGDDRLTLIDDDFEDKVEIELGDGDDDLSVEDCDFDEAVEIDGGDDHDELDNQGGNSLDLGETIRIRRFEDID
jgi:orotate phosphoribosyltransferase